jgi:hypothetical protein
VVASPIPKRAKQASQPATSTQKKTSRHLKNLKAVPLDFLATDSDRGALLFNFKKCLFEIFEQKLCLLYSLTVSFKPAHLEVRRKELPSLL